jgi:transposase InsO family protein
MSRRSIENLKVDFSLLNISLWPSVLVEELGPEDRNLFLKRKKAVDLFVSTDMKVKDIEKETGLRRDQIHRLVKRCLEKDENEDILGYRALIPYKRLKDYNRNAFPEDKDSNNYSGAFSLLLDTYPTLKELIINLYLNRKTNKNKISDPIISVKNLHKKFINECRALGIKLNEYPFNTKTLAIKSLERYVKSLSKNHFVEVAKRNGQQAAMVAKNTGIGNKNNPMIIRPLERVEFDGHRIDTSIAIVFKTPEGDEIVEVINRIWILSIVDVGTRAILGYHLCLNKEYSSDDVLMCIRNAIIPWKKKSLTIEELSYSDKANFPSGYISEARFGIWDEFCYDNAKANIAKNVKSKLIDLIGCSINMGPVAVPVRRPIIERFFRTLEQNGFHRLPTTTGSNPQDPKRNKPEENAIKYKITSEQLEELTDVLIAEYNGSPHEGNNNLSPLEVFQQRIKRGMSIIQLPEGKRNEIAFFSLNVTRRVNGSVKHGRRPFVIYEGVRYTNEILSRSPQLINKTLKLIINTDDLRIIKAFLEDGSELGNLSALGKWGITPHDLRTRKAINKLKNKKILHFTKYDDPISVYQNYLEKEASKNKTSRNKFANLKKAQKGKAERYPKTQNSNDNALISSIDSLEQNKIINRTKDEDGADKRILKRTITF